MQHCPRCQKDAMWGLGHNFTFYCRNCGTLEGLSFGLVLVQLPIFTFLAYQWLTAPVTNKDDVAMLATIYLTRPGLRLSRAPGS